MRACRGVVACAFAASVLSSAADAHTPDLLTASPCESGCAYGWTLATRMGEFLSEAERRFGPRDTGWTLLGVELVSRGSPKIWYPILGGEKRFIAVQVTVGAADDESRALFQLAHEVVHLLAPTGQANASRFEEGLATLFAVEMLREIGFSAGVATIGESAYRAVYEEVRALRASETGEAFDARVRLLRAANGGFSPMTAAALKQAFPKISAERAERLAAPFP